MAFMGFREPNEVRWVGVRPAHRGEHFAVSSLATNATVVLYTVPAGKTCYLCGATLSTYQGVVNGTGTLVVRNAADVLQYTLATLVNPVTTSLVCPMIFTPPIEIAAGWDIAIVSNLAGVTAHGFIRGWVE